MTASHRFDIELVVEIRERAMKARELPMDGAQTWVKSPVDPMRLAAVFAPAVQVRPGWVLRAYRTSGGLGGGGLVYRMRETDEFPEPALCMTEVAPNFKRPVPPGGVASWEPAFFDALELDGTPWSYLCASLLVREAGAFGEEWHAIAWGNRKILGHDPADPAAAAAVPEAARFTINVPPGGPPPMRIETATIERDGVPVQVPWIRPDASGWNLSANATWPTDWRPEVRFLDGDVVEVALILYSAHLMSRIFCETDRYVPGTQGFTRTEAWIAGGPQGFVY